MLKLYVFVLEIRLMLTTSAGTSRCDRLPEISAVRAYNPFAREVDPRYAFRSQTIREWLGGEELIAPDLWPDLRALAPPHVIHERRQEREREREKHREVRNRVAEGRYERTRDEFLRMATDRRTQATELRQQGLSWKEIGALLGVSAEAARMLGRRGK